MKRKLFSLVLSTVLAGSAVTPCIAAAASAESLAEIIRAGLPDEVIPAETPTEDCISYHCEYQYEGVAVTCEDIEALKKDGLNGIPVEWSDGIWSTYWNPAGAEFLLQPLEGLSKEFGDFLKYEGGIPDGAEDMAFTLPEEYTDLDEPVYVLYAPKTDTGRLDAALAADSSVTVIGALFCGMLDPMEYIGPLFTIVAEDGVNLTPEFFGEYAPYASFDPVENAWNIPLAVDENTTLEEALVIQKQIAAMDGIRSVGMLGMCLESLENPVTTTAKNIPFTPKALTGDVDGDGKVTAFDASLALTGFNEATVMGYEPEERTLTPAQEQIADVDGDGELTAFDASMILTYFNMKFNGGYDDLTWADVLPEA
ncbi:MAG: dockerin type I repeat-containing protein [Oscillospiraceae bacterium]|nr:dockerin type I repeat-containing protein [Oscillospiraceae bacterium]